MTDSAQQSAEAVAALFAERQRFEAWLATLDAKRAVTPAHVYTKVHADYTARLQRVNEQLGRHRAALQEMETELADRLTSLDIDEAKHKDEMAEAELRSNVGELDPREHREILERTALGLEQVTADRLKVTAELANLRAMLGDDGEIGVLEIGAGEVTVTRTPPMVPAMPAKRASKPETPAMTTAERDAWGLGPDDPLAVPARASGPSPAEPQANASPFDDLEFLRSMVDARKSGDNAAVQNGSNSPPPAAKKAPKEAPEPKAKEKEPAPAAQPVAAAPPAPAPAPPPAAPPPAPEPAVIAAAAEASAKSMIIDPSISMEMMTVAKPRASAEAVPSYLRDVPPEQVKTLKCQECATLNYPTEWYCERCGAELAAL